MQSKLEVLEHIGELVDTLPQNIPPEVSSS